MATRGAYLSAQGTSASSTTITAHSEGIEVINLDGGGVIFFTVDGSTTASAADEMWMVPQVAGARQPVRVNKWPVTVSCYATATTKVGIRAINE